MKRFIAVLLVVLATACLVTGCSSGMNDGTYKAQFKDYDDHGWKDYVSITAQGRQNHRCGLRFYERRRNQKIRGSGVSGKHGAGVQNLSGQVL